jgi:hypothetical protein
MDTAIAYDQYKFLFDQLSTRYLKFIEQQRFNHCSIAETNFNRELDAITDELQKICENLIATRAITSEHLRLKAQALLCLLPDDNDPAVVLAESLCEDLVACRSTPPAVNRTS